MVGLISTGHLAFPSAVGHTASPEDLESWCFSKLSTKCLRVKVPIVFQ